MDHSIETVHLAGEDSGCGKFGQLRTPQPAELTSSATDLFPEPLWLLGGWFGPVTVLGAGI